MPNVYAVIMAGGVGSRFWPRSREKSPKQLLEILERGTMIQNTVKRIESLVDPTRTLVITNRVQKAAIAKQLPKLPQGNIIVEPIGRNTAPCIALAALFIRRLDPAAVMIVLPADHIMQDADEFRRILRLAVEVAEESKTLVTVGIQPTRPETGYGYIQVREEQDGGNPWSPRGVRTVKTFAEKPNLETARKFLASGDFYWNSGMFVWRVDTILDQIERQLPDMWKELQRVDAAIGSDNFDHVLENAYRIIRPISIDYGVMEKAKSVFVIPGKFGWSDVGSWDEVVRLSGKDDAGNSVKGTTYLLQTNNTFIDAGDTFVAAIGVEDLVIIATPDAVLVCRQGASQDVKEVVDFLRRKQMTEYL